MNENSSWHVLEKKLIWNSHWPGHPVSLVAKSGNSIQGDPQSMTDWYSPAPQNGKIYRYNLCSRAPCRIKLSRQTQTSLERARCLASSPSLFCFSYSLACFSWNHFINKWLPYESLSKGLFLGGHDLRYLTFHTASTTHRDVKGMRITVLKSILFINCSLHLYYFKIAIAYCVQSLAISEEPCVMLLRSYWALPNPFILFPALKWLKSNIKKTRHLMQHCFHSDMI